MKRETYKFRAVLIIVLINLLISTFVFAQSSQKNVIGGLIDYPHWSSPESDYDSSDGAWSQFFDSGEHNCASKSGSFRVRAIRAF